LLPPGPLRTGRDSFPSSGSSLGQRIVYTTPVQGHLPPGRNMPHGARTRPTRGPVAGPILHVTTGEPLPRLRCERPLGLGREHQQGHYTPPTYLLCLLRRLALGSRAPSPEGSLPGFPWGDVATPIRPITGRPSLSPSSSARNPIGWPCGSLSPRGGLRVYHVSYQYQSGLGRASRPVAQHLRQGNAEAPAPGHVPFGPSLSAPYASLLAC